MAKVKKAKTAHKRHRKLIKQAKGYYGARSRVFRVVKQAVIRAQQYAYRDRRVRKRDFRSLWILRINAAARKHGLSYSKFMKGLKENNLSINRKMLADLAVHNEKDFARLAEKIKASLSKSQS